MSEKSVFFLNFDLGSELQPGNLPFGYALVYMWTCGFFVKCGCFDNCVDVLVICVLVFTVFCIVLFMYIYSYLLLV